MFIPFGPALDAELAYRRDDVADSARRGLRRRVTGARSAVPATVALPAPRTPVRDTADCPASAA